jgi:hypothetical protein
MTLISIKQTCFACPTVFEWKNKKGHDIYFRLRHGYARIVNETKNKTILQGIFPYGDGVCTQEEMIQ